MACYIVFLIALSCVLFQSTILASGGFEQFPLTQDSLLSITESCHKTCAVLSQSYPHLVHHYPTPEFSTTYFSAQQRSTIPACILSPASSSDVSLLIQKLSRGSCPFAAKSGGHAMFVGASNSPGGITIDLRGLDSMSLEDREGDDGEEPTLMVGTGKKWGEVYEFLEDDGRELTVVGGRDSMIGVGGFVLGGGIGFISRRVGWAFDNVKAFELVLPNSTITDVSHTSNPDLYFALRGGLSNFGIVTRFDLETHRQGLTWGGHSFYLLNDTLSTRSSPSLLSCLSSPKAIPEAMSSSISQFAVRAACKLGYCYSASSLFSSLANFAETEDERGQVIVSFAWVPYVQTWVACLYRLYGLPEENPEVFRDFEGYRSVLSTVRVQGLKGMMDEIDWLNAVGYRQNWKSATYKVGKDFMSQLVGIFMEEMESIRGVWGLLPSLICQIITREEIRNFGKNGGNAIGIREGDGPLLLINSAIRWNNAEDDDIVEEANEKILKRAMDLAKEMDVYHPYIYSNYAGKNQVVLEGYGEASSERLKRIRKEVDPEGVFEILTPGYFKL